jgi:hypothetical protein
MLADLYSSQTRARSVNTWIALTTTKKLQLSVADYYSKMCYYTDELATTGAPCTSWQASTRTTTQSSPPSWLELILSLRLSCLFSSLASSSTRLSRCTMLLVAPCSPWWPLTVVATQAVAVLITVMAADVTVVDPRVAASPTAIPSPHAPPTVALGLNARFA